MIEILLYATVVLVSTCGLVYELVAGAVSTYLLGDSVTQLSTIIGVHLSAMGVGAYLSKFVEQQPAARFVDCQLGASLVGGLSGPILYSTFAESSHVRLALYVLVALTGILIGAEVPLLMRILRRRAAFRDVVPRVLSMDYVGALLGALLFALVLLPALGIMLTGIVLGCVGAVVGLWGTFVFESSLDTRPLRIRGVLVLAVLLGALGGAKTVVRVADESLMLQPPLFAKQTRYQRIVLTKAREGFSLFLDGNLQFASVDEYRYHEALVHPVMALAPRRKRVLVLGGGDGLAVRELLRYPDVEEIVLVDLDPEMTRLATELPELKRLNGGALGEPRVRVLNADALVWLSEAKEPAENPFDVAVVDFPDPNNFGLSKLYTVHFYKLLRRALTKEGAVVVQSTSPLVARKSYWCIMRTLEAAGYVVRPYHALVPTFGEWGFALAQFASFDAPKEVLGGLRYLTSEGLGGLFHMAPDMGPVDVEINRLNTQMLVRYYEQDRRRQK